MSRIEADNLCVSLNDKEILKNLSFAAEKNILTILGPNGCGKTTLIRSLCGLIKPDKGSIYINGENLKSKNPAQWAKDIAYISQEHNPVYDFLVEEVVLMGRAPYLPPLANPGKEDKRLAAEAMEMAGISLLSRRPYTQISGGERKLTRIAMALAQETDIILMDEPISSLDLKNEWIIMKHIKELAEHRGKTIIISAHDANKALFFDGNALFLCEDKEYISGKAKEIINKTNLSRLYNIEFEKGVMESGKEFYFPR